MLKGIPGITLHDQKSIPTRELFAQRDLRCTPQREALYDVLRNCVTHPTVEELHQLVTQEHDMSVSLATVYNTVEALCKSGLARRLPTGNGSCRFDANTDEHLHVRFLDTSEILDVPDELSNKILGCLRNSLLEQVKKQLGVEIESISIQLLARRDGNGSNGRPNHNGPLSADVEADNLAADDSSSSR